MDLDRKYLDFLFVLEPSLADNDVLDAAPVSKLLLKHGVVLEELLRLILGDSVQGILVDHPNTLKLRRRRQMNVSYTSDFLFYM